MRGVIACVLVTFNGQIDSPVLFLKEYRTRRVFLHYFKCIKLKPRWCYDFYKRNFYRRTSIGDARPLISIASKIYLIGYLTFNSRGQRQQQAA